MRISALLSLVLLTSSPALAWIPKLDDSTAKNVIDAAYGRRDALPTYLTDDLSVQDGKFKSDGAVKAFDGGDTCLADWLSAPTAFDKSGSRPASLTLSGQADQLSFQAADARANFKNLSAADALKAFGAGFLPNSANDYGTKVIVKSDTTATQTGNTSSSTTTTAVVQPQGLVAALPDGQIRLDLVVAGLGDLKQRAAYLVRLKGPDGKLLAPVRSSYVNDWKADASGKQGGTLVYYFEPTKAGINANDKVDVLVRTEAANSCAYAVNFDLGQFY